MKSALAIGQRADLATIAYFGQGPDIGCTVCTLNSRTGGVLAAPVTVAGAAADRAAGTNVPSTCTRWPIHGVMSVPDRR